MEDLQKGDSCNPEAIVRGTRRDGRGRRRRVYPRWTTRSQALKMPLAKANVPEIRYQEMSGKEGLQLQKMSIIRANDCLLNRSGEERVLQRRRAGGWPCRNQPS